MFERCSLRIVTCIIIQLPVENELPLIVECPPSRLKIRKAQVVIGLFCRGHRLPSGRVQGSGQCPASLTLDPLSTVHILLPRCLRPGSRIDREHGFHHGRWFRDDQLHNNGHGHCKRGDVYEGLAEGTQNSPVSPELFAHCLALTNVRSDRDTVLTPLFIVPLFSVAKMAARKQALLMESSSHSSKTVV